MSKKPHWYVYIVQCTDNTLYTGITTDLKRRLRQHNGELAGGAKYTQARRPVTLIYSEPAENRAAASQREYQIRKLSKKEKLLLKSAP